MAEAPATSVEAELEELQRKYRIMEGDRKAYADEVQNVLRKQRTHIDKLQKENLQLKQDLSLETRAAAMGGAMRLSSQINKMTDMGDQYARKIELERQRASQLDKQVETLKAQLLKTRQAMGGIHAPGEADSAVHKQVGVLENRLDKALVKFNESIAHNKGLREEIDNLRRERLVFDNLYKKLQRELAEKKRAMAEVIESANVSYEERDKVTAQVNKVKAASDKEQRDFEVEWKALGDVLDEDLRKHESLSRELQRDVVSAAVPDEDRRGSMGIADELALKKQMRRATWGLAKDRAAHAASVEKVASYEEAFEKIRDATGLNDIDDLVAKFIDAEDQNFSRFNYLNELNAEIERAEEAVTELKAEIDHYKGHDRGADTQRRKHARDLEARVRAAEARVGQFDERFHAATRLVTSVGAQIEGLCEKIGCNMPFLREVGGDDGVNESNMMVYLGVIEQRTNELLRAMHALYGRAQRAGQQISVVEGDDNKTFLTSGANVTTPLSARGAPTAPTDLVAAMALTVPTASLEDADTDDDDGGRPLSRDELKARTTRGLAKKSEGASPAGGGVAPTMPPTAPGGAGPGATATGTKPHLT